MRYLQNTISIGFGTLFIRITSLKNIQLKADETQGPSSQLTWEVLLIALQFLIEYLHKKTQWIIFIASSLQPQCCTIISIPQVTFNYIQLQYSSRLHFYIEY